MPYRQNLSSGRISPCDDYKVPSRAKAKPPNDQSEKDARFEKLDGEIDSALARFGQQVRLLRKGRGVTQLDIYERTGLTSGAISRIENGHRDLTVRSILKMALGLGVQPSELSMLLDRGPRSNTTDRSSIGVDVPVIVAPGVSSQSVDEVTQELSQRGARPRQVVGRRR